jgi:surfactin synthase thioesterase subunit
MLARWFHPELPSQEASARIFLFPYAGGSAPMYRDWLGLFPADVAAQAVQLPGRLDRRDEPLIEDLDEIVEATCEALAAELDDRPYAVFGHSMGALVAYRVAVAMQRDFGQGPMLLASAAWAPEGFAMPTREQVEMPQDELLQWVIGLGSLPPVMYEDPEMLAVTLPPTRADLRACIDYVDDGAQLDCPVLAYAGSADPLLTPEAAGSWAKRTPDHLGTVVFSGGHFFIYDNVLPIVTDLTAHIRRHTRRHSSAGST